MKKSSKRGILYSVLILMVLLFFGGRAFIFWKIKKTFSNKIENLQSQGIAMTYLSFDVNFFSGNLKLKEVQIKIGSDSVCSSGGTIEELSIKGISFISLLLDKKLSISSVVLRHPWVLYADHHKKTNSEKSRANSSLKDLQIDLVRIDSGRLEMVDSASCGVTLKARLNFVLDNFSVTNINTDSMKWKVEDVTASAIAIDLPTRFYSLTLQKLSYHHKEKLIQLDSLELLPTLDRLEFAKKTGRQMDQFNLMMASLVVNGFEMSETIKPSFIAREVVFRFNLEVFRDKRFQRALRKPTILPVAFLHKLNFPLHIDSIRILPSLVSYQEHPEKGDAIGRISFNDLSAAIYNVSNDSSGISEMKVRTRFMNAGDLNVNFKFPHEVNKIYAAKGSLLNFSMPEINTMLEPVANIKIETGQLQAMKFNFQYDNKKSEGELELRYTDLKILGVKDDAYKSTNKIVTLIIGAFVKKKIDKNDSKDKRTGNIHWERDTQKAIFNYWWKSVLSGIKSVYGFENSSEKKGKKK